MGLFSGEHRRECCECDSLTCGAFPLNHPLLASSLLSALTSSFGFICCSLQQHDTACRKDVGDMRHCTVAEESPHCSTAAPPRQLAHQHRTQSAALNAVTQHHYDPHFGEDGLAWPFPAKAYAVQQQHCKRQLLHLENSSKSLRTSQMRLLHAHHRLACLVFHLCMI